MIADLLPQLELDELIDMVATREDVELGPLWEHDADYAPQFAEALRAHDHLWAFLGDFELSGVPAAIDLAYHRGQLIKADIELFDLPPGVSRNDFETIWVSLLELVVAVYDRQGGRVAHERQDWEDCKTYRASWRDQRLPPLLAMATHSPARCMIRLVIGGVPVSA